MSTSALRHVANVRVFVDPARWDESVRFYSLTLGIALHVRDDVNRYAMLGFEQGPTLILEPDLPEGDEPKASGRFTGLSFLVDDVDTVHADLVAHGVVFVHPPETMFWGGRLAHFADPSDNVLTLAQYPQRAPAK
jgi:predicted enzyme related to lactoylglutathione lyase